MAPEGSVRLGFCSGTKGIWHRRLVREDNIHLG